MADIKINMADIKMNMADRKAKLCLITVKLSRNKRKGEYRTYVTNVPFSSFAKLSFPPPSNPPPPAHFPMVV